MQEVKANLRRGDLSRGCGGRYSLPGPSVSLQQLAICVSRQKFPCRHASVQVQGTRHPSPSPPAGSKDDHTDGALKHRPALFSPNTKYSFLALADGQREQVIIGASLLALWESESAGTQMGIPRLVPWLTYEG